MREDEAQGSKLNGMLVRHNAENATRAKQTKTPIFFAKAINSKANAKDYHDDENYAILIE